MTSVMCKNYVSNFTLLSQCFTWWLQPWLGVPKSALADSEPGKYVACVYNQEWFIGSIKHSEEHNEVYVKFMKLSHIYNTILASWQEKSLLGAFSWQAVKLTFQI